MTSMKTTEIRNAVLTSGLNALNLPDTVIQYGNSDYALPVVDPNGETRYVKISLSVANNKDTKTTKAFDPEVARQVWLDTMAEKEAEKARVKAEREAKKAAKANG